MHDFCFTIPYGIVVLLGGLFGYIRKHSASSLIGGGTGGLVMVLAGYWSLKAFEKGGNSYAALLTEAVVSLALTIVMAQRYAATLKFMPAGMVAALSGAMALFLIFKLAAGGNRIAKVKS